MKKTVLTIALAIMTLAANAQVLKNDLLNGYKEGDTLEKNEYKSTKAPVVKHTWSAAAGGNPAVGSESPKIGNALTYTGYDEGGLSINLGSFPDGVKGGHFSTYSLTDSGKDYAKEAYYLTCLINLSDLASKSYSELLAFSANHTGGSSRGQLHIAKTGKDKIKLTVAFGKERASSSVTVDFNKTHLIVLKLDYDKQNTSLFVNPELSKNEPEASATVAYVGDKPFTGGIKAITVKDRDIYNGSIGSFRFASSWADALGIK